MKKLIPFLIIGFILNSCSDDDSPDDSNLPDVVAFNELTVPSSFNWSSSLKEEITVTFLADAASPVDLDGSYLWLIDANDNRVAMNRVNGNKAVMNITLPALSEGYSFYLPATGEQWPLEMSPQVNLSVQNPLSRADSTGSFKTISGSKTMANPPGTNLFGNADFEQNFVKQTRTNSIAPNAGTVDDQEWNFWTSNFNLTNVNGSTVFQASSSNYIWQWQTVTPGDSIHLYSDYNGSAVAYLIYYNSPSSSSYVSYDIKTLTNSSNGISDIVPNNANVVCALLYVYGGSWIDNAFLSNPSAVVDADGDGVADGDDDFPNDATRAYLTHYPSSGSLTVAFEDFWPLTGDYDFNDLVTNLKVDLIKDANNKWVSADFTLALDAVGAGIESGLAIRLTNSNKQTMSSIISSISGDATLDPSVTNGLIVFNDPDDLRSTYYTNTVPSLTAVPDTARFTINFNNSNNGDAFLPDVYIFHTNERGREIHLPGFSGTVAADASLNNTGDDVNGSYQTVSGLPWGMELVLSEGTNFKHPFEKTDMIIAYPDFSTWATSGGSSNQNWFDNPSLGDVIDPSSF